MIKAFLRVMVLITDNQQRSALRRVAAVFSSFLIIVAGILAGLVVYRGASVQEKLPSAPALQGQEVGQQTEVVVVFQEGCSDSACRIQKAVPFEEGMNALNILERAGFRLQTKVYSFGTFVEAIDSVQGGEGNRYWMYYVNGTLGSVAADAYAIRPGDRVEWRFEQSRF